MMADADKPFKVGDLVQIREHPGPKPGKVAAFTQGGRVIVIWPMPRSVGYRRVSVSTHDPSELRHHDEPAEAEE
jgi:hypothetical protein